MAKFCSRCGKPLTPGTPCSCLNTTPAPSPSATTPTYTTTTPSSTHAYTTPSSTAFADEPWKNPGYASSPTSVVSPTTTEVYPTTAKGFAKISLSDILPMDKITGIWYKFKNRIGIGDPETNSTNVYERGLKIVPECISANEGEIPVRQYTVAKLSTFHKLHFAEGRLQVTNKRVIFRAPGNSITGRTILQHDFAIDEIAGIEARKEPAFQVFSYLLALGFVGLFQRWLFDFCTMLSDSAEILGVIFGLIIATSSVVPAFTMHKKFFLKGLIAACGAGAMEAVAFTLDNNKFFMALAFSIGVVSAICIFLHCMKPRLVLTIKTKGASGAIEIRKKKKRGLLAFLHGNQASDKEEYTGFSRVYPMQDTERSIREISAIISDIQKLGDYGVEKWKED